MKWVLGVDVDLQGFRPTWWTEHAFVGSQSGNSTQELERGGAWIGRCQGLAAPIHALIHRRSEVTPFETLHGSCEFYGYSTLTLTQPKPSPSLARMR